MDMIRGEASRRLSIPLETERSYTPDRKAMLAALGIVLDQPKIPIVLKDKDERTGAKSLNDSARREP